MKSYFGHGPAAHCASLIFVFLVATALSAVGADFNSAKLRDIDQAITTAITDKRMPGAVFWLERGGEVYRKAYGNRTIEPAVTPMQEDAIFDAASLTKV